MNDKGHSVASLAERYEIPYFTLYSIKRGYTYKNAGGPISEAEHPAVPRKRKRKIRKLRKKGASIARLADATGLSESTIRNIVKDD